MLQQPLSLLGHCLLRVYNGSLAARFMVRGECARLIARVSQVQNYAAPIADFLMNGRRLIRISEGACIGCAKVHLATIYARLCQRILRYAIKDAKQEGVS